LIFSYLASLSAFAAFFLASLSAILTLPDICKNLKIKPRKML
jgi:hypothetical protein